MTALVELSPGQLVTALREAARSLAAEDRVRDRDGLLTELVWAAVATIPHADGGGISCTEAGTVSSAHATSGDVGDLDLLQSELGQGPSITAADDPPDSGIVIAHDLGGEDRARWPSFAPAAVRAGYRSMVSTQLSLRGKRRSTLNLYARHAYVFDDTAQLTAGLFAVQAALLLHGADHAAHLSHALDTRDTIARAKGILTERFTVDDDHAFRMLVRASQDTNVKLIDVARWLTHEADQAAQTAQATQTAEPSRGWK